MNAEDEFRLLSRFTDWLFSQGISRPIADADVYRFLEGNR